jgi:deazaflavin-dependent oxidoreductase (nitroreductase family)
VSESRREDHAGRDDDSVPRVRLTPRRGTDEPSVPRAGEGTRPADPASGDAVTTGHTAPDHASSSVPAQVATRSRVDAVDAPADTTYRSPGSETSGRAARTVSDVTDRPVDSAEWHEDVVAQFRRTGGTVEYYGRALVLLHHRGAQTGTERVTPIVGIPEGDGWLIAASRRGHARNPAWLANLLAHPDVEIEAPDHGTVAVRATRLDGVERDQAWSRFTGLSPVFAEYQASTDRVIPVLRLTRR